MGRPPRGEESRLSDHGECGIGDHVGPAGSPWCRSTVVIPAELKSPTVVGQGEHRHENTPGLTPFTGSGGTSPAAPRSPAPAPPDAHRPPPTPGSARRPSPTSR